MAKRENSTIKNPGLKPIKGSGKELITDKNNKINNNNLKVTLNQGDLPTVIQSKKDREWEVFENLVKKNIRARLENIAMSTIKWTNLPDGMIDRVIEYGFLTRGWVCAFTDPIEGDLALPAMPNFFNVNWNPVFASVYGSQGFFKTVHCKYKGKDLKPIVNVDEITRDTNIEAVICRDNNYGEANMPKLYIDYVKEYTEILSNLKLGMLVSAERLKQPFIIAVKKKALGKMANKLVNKVLNNKTDVVLIDEQMEADKSVKDYIEFIDLKGDSEAPKKLQELWELQFNNFLTQFGINTNPTPDKSQYVNSPEVNSNNELLRLESSIRLDVRKKWCEDCKELLGFDMQCELNQDNDELKNMVNQMKGELGNESMEIESDTESDI